MPALNPPLASDAGFNLAKKLDGMQAFTGTYETGFTAKGT
jgi:hypothetical protein